MQILGKPCGCCHTCGNRLEKSDTDSPYCPVCNCVRLYKSHNDEGARDSSSCLVATSNFSFNLGLAGKRLKNVKNSSESKIPSVFSGIIDSRSILRVLKVNSVCLFRGVSSLIDYARKLRIYPALILVSVDCGFSLPFTVDFIREFVKGVESLKAAKLVGGSEVVDLTLDGQEDYPYNGKVDISDIVNIVFVSPSITSRSEVLKEFLLLAVNYFSLTTRLLASGERDPDLLCFCGELLGTIDILYDEYERIANPAKN